MLNLHTTCAQSSLWKAVIYGWCYHWSLNKYTIFNAILTSVYTDKHTYLKPILLLSASIYIVSSKYTLLNSLALSHVLHIMPIINN